MQKIGDLENKNQIKREEKNKFEMLINCSFEILKSSFPDYSKA